MSTKLSQNVYNHKILDEFNYGFALEFAKNAESNFVYTLATANVYQLVPNMVLMYVSVRSWKSSIINLMGTEWSELSAPY